MWHSHMAVPPSPPSISELFTTARWNSLHRDTLACPRTNTSSPLLPPPVPHHTYSIFCLCGADCCRYCIEWNHTQFFLCFWPISLSIMSWRFSVWQHQTEFLSLSLLFTSLVFSTSSPLPYRMCSCSWAPTPQADWFQDQPPMGASVPFIKKVWRLHVTCPHPLVHFKIISRLLIIPNVI